MFLCSLCKLLKNKSFCICHWNFLQFCAISCSTCPDVLKAFKIVSRYALNFFINCHAYQTGKTAYFAEWNMVEAAPAHQWCGCHHEGLAVATLPFTRVISWWYFFWLTPLHVKALSGWPFKKMYNVGYNALQTQTCKAYRKLPVSQFYPVMTL